MGFQAMYPLRSACAGLFLALVAALPQHNACAAAPAASEDRVALVIGNSTYKEAPLANPVNDATDIARALQEAGFKVILKRNASTREMRQAIRDFGNELRRAQVGLFYFAGHGVQVKGNNYLVPVGADIQSEADAEDLAIDANYALRTMEESQAQVSIVILDACRNNPFARSFRSVSRGLAQMTAATGSLVAFATAPGSVASDGKGRNGIYTKHLLASLAQPDTDILKVFQRTRAGVVKETGGKQTPWESTSLIGDFYFRPPAGGAQVATVAPNIAVARPPAAPGSLAAMIPGTVFRDCEGCPEMVVIPAGSFIMGSHASEPGRDGDEGPQHQVTIPRAFAVGKLEVTRGQFARFVQEAGYAAGSGCYALDGKQWNADASRHWRNPGFAQSDDDPVACVNWHDANAYVEWLSRKSGKRYRLPTEAEWEYSARAGTTTAFSFGARITPQQANYNTALSYAGSPVATTPRSTVSVGSYAPNAFGLYDMHGNVWEWTEDCWNSSYTAGPSDGSAWTSGDCGRRVMRGGAWNDKPGSQRSANRGNFNPARRYFSGGLRLARTD